MAYMRAWKYVVEGRRNHQWYLHAFVYHLCRRHQYTSKRRDHLRACGFETQAQLCSSLVEISGMRIEREKCVHCLFYS